MASDDADTPHLDRFRVWVETTEGFELCTLQQQLMAYAETFPGRILPLLIEVLQVADNSWKLPPNTSPDTND